MNSDLIYRSALIEKIESTDWYHISKSGNLAKGANSELHTPLFKADDIFTALENAPAVDAVIPVLCRDCKYWGDEEGKLQCSDGALLARCKVHNYLIDGRHTGWCPTENDFCSYGERKEGAD